MEFVSANPTGPMHVGHARNAAYGDALARLLAFHGHDVQREFYVNDAGSQVLQARRVDPRAGGRHEVPEDGYRGRLRGATWSRALPDASTTAATELGAGAVALIVGQLEELAAAVSGELRLAGRMRAACTPASRARWRTRAGAPRAAGSHLHCSDGALWLRTTEFGDDKDRVLVRSSGEHTYFASDIAYHQSKRERGFERQIDVWGADHHGYLARMKAAYEALGGDPASWSC